MMATDATLLLVEDDPNAVKLLCLSLLKAGFGNRVITAGSAEEAMKYLLGEGVFSDRAQYPLPQLVLLDLKLPGLSGIDFLRWLRASPAGKSLPVVVLTGSIIPEDLIDAYKAGANSYITKAQDAQNLTEQVEAIGSIWLRHGRFPAD